MRGLLVGALVGLSLAACNGEPQAARSAAGPGDHAVSAGGQATQASPTSPLPPATAPPAAEASPPPPNQAPQAAAPQAPPPNVRAFPLGGNGSVTVTMMGGSATVTVVVSGLRAIAHAVHLHAGCNGSLSAHIATIGTVGSSGTLSITVPNRLLGAVVIVYPGASSVGQPILYGATA
jgi:hypothetical protein